MSSNGVNYGNQSLVFDYRQEARSKGFNSAFCDTLPQGLYLGANLTRISDTTINVSPLVCIIKSDEDDRVALRIETADSQNISLASQDNTVYAEVSKPYIILRFGWQDTEVNYMDIKAVAWSTLPEEEDPEKLHPLDIILGKVLFSRAEQDQDLFIIDPNNPFDLSRRQEVFSKEVELLTKQFRVSSSENDPKKVFISGGKVNTSLRRFEIPGTEFPQDGIPDTESFSRTDLIVINVNGEFQFIKGTPSATYPAPPPRYGTYKVLAEIRRGANRIDVTGPDIFQVVENTVHGPFTAEDIEINDPDGFLPPNSKNISDAFNFIFHRVPAISPNDEHTLNVVLRRHIKWGVLWDDEVYAGCIPINNIQGLFVSDNVESALTELAMHLSDINEHVEATFDNGNIIHGLEIVDDENYPLS